jgi:diguanylate cyclase (GGDEF)-like protein
MFSDDQSVILQHLLLAELASSCVTDDRFCDAAIDIAEAFKDWFSPSVTCAYLVLIDRTTRRRRNIPAYPCACPHPLEAEAACIPLIHDGAALGWMELHLAGPATFASGVPLSVDLAIQQLTASRALIDLREKTMVDPLTGLLVRTAFLERLAKDLPRWRRQRGGAVLFVDGDRFGDINKAHGHAAGDTVLKAIGRRLRAQVSLLGEGAFAGRIGEGDEFAVALPALKLDAAIQSAEGVRRALCEPFLSQTISIEIGISIGVAVCPDDGTQFSALIAAADRAQMLAKLHGGNCVRTAHEVLQVDPTTLAVLSQAYLARRDEERQRAGS